MRRLFYALLTTMLILSACEKNSEVTMPEVETSYISEITGISAVCVGKLLNDGGAPLIAHGLVWGEEEHPTIKLETRSIEYADSNQFKVVITNLNPDTRYYIRAYAINCIGTKYGEELSFTTNGAPILTTFTISNITSHTAVCGGSVVSDNGAPITSRGVVWGTKKAPNIDRDSTIVEGKGNGDFQCNIAGLEPGVTYYVRAFAENDIGVAYGEERRFVASPVVPTLDVVRLSYITTSTAFCEGVVLDNGGSPITECGWVWSTVENPTVDLSTKVVCGQNDTIFRDRITGLSPRTTYYVRAYAVNEAGTAYGRQESFSTLAQYSVRGYTFNMVKVEGGSFYMGAQNQNGSSINYDEEAYPYEQPVHRVTLNNYFIGQYEVTQGLWWAVMESWSKFAPTIAYGVGENYPVYGVSWNEIQVFLAKLNELTGMKFSLTTEAQWEYAARGGIKSRGFKFSGSNDLDEVSWYTDNSIHTSHPVGLKEPNELNIYDMTGNVWEWCSDWYGEYSEAHQVNPAGPSVGTERVFRSGGWNGGVRFGRVAHRIKGFPNHHYYGAGFRIVLNER